MFQDRPSSRQPRHQSDELSAIIEEECQAPAQSASDAFLHAGNDMPTTADDNALRDQQDEDDDGSEISSESDDELQDMYAYYCKCLSF